MVLAGLASVIVAAVPASAADDSAAECQSQDTERRIAGCTDLLLSRDCTLKPPLLPIRCGPWPIR